MHCVVGVLVGVRSAFSWGPGGGGGGGGPTLFSLFPPCR